MVQATLTEQQYWEGTLYPSGVQDVPASLAIALGVLNPAAKTLQPEIILVASTSDDTPTDMLVGGEGVKFAIANNHVGVFEGRVWGQVNGTHAVTAWTIAGVISNTAGTTAIVGTVTPVAISSVETGWAIAVSADDTNDALNVEVTGAASTDIVWRASIQMNLDPFPTS